MTEEFFMARAGWDTPFLLNAYLGGKKTVVDSRRIDFIVEAPDGGARCSEIHLINGKIIWVALSLRELNDRFYMRNGKDMGVVDLCDATKNGNLRSTILEPGQKMPDGTIYLGKYTPRDRAGNSLRKTFNVFAAPEDLPGGTRTYNQTVDYIAGLKNWNGYDGANYVDDGEIYLALQKNSYEGGWIIPPKEILSLLFKNREKEHLKGTFCNASKKQNTDYPEWYFSSTPVDGVDCSVGSLNFLDGDNGSILKSGGCDSCRPVRFVPV